MTINGWLQIWLFFGAGVSCHEAPGRVYGSRIQSREDVYGSGSSAH
jgi:hypothetical protein